MKTKGEKSAFFSKDRQIIITADMTTVSNTIRERKPISITFYSISRTNTVCAYISTGLECFDINSPVSFQPIHFPIKISEINSRTVQLKHDEHTMTRKSCLIKQNRSSLDDRKIEKTRPSSVFHKHIRYGRIGAQEFILITKVLRANAECLSE